MSAGANHLHDLMLKAKSRADLDVVTKALNDVDAGKLQLLRGSQGFLKTEGLNAPAALDRVRSERRKLQTTIASRLANDERRSAFELQMQRKNLATEELIEKHVGNQLRAVGETEHALRLEHLLGQAVTSYTDPVARDTAFAQGRGFIRAKATTAGLSTEAIEQLESRWRQTVSSAVLQRFMAQKDLTGARDYFAQAKDGLGPKAAQFEETIGQLERDEQGEHQAMALVDAARDPRTKWVDERKAWDNLDAMPPGPLKDEARRRLANRLEVEERLKTKEQVEHYKTALSQFLTGGLGAVNSAERRWLQTNAPERWQAIENSAEHKARARAADARQDRAEQVAIKRQQDLADQEALLAFRKLSPQQQGDADIVAEHGSSASPKALAAMLKEQATIRQKSAAGELPKMEDFKSLVDAAVSRHVAPLPTHQRKSHEAKLRGRAAAWLEDRRGADGKMPTREEMREALKSLAGDVIIEGWLSSDTKKRYELTAEEEEELLLKQQKPVASPVVIPASERKLIEDALRTTGREVTDEAVRDLYNRKSATRR